MSEKKTVRRSVAIALGIVCIIFVAGIGGVMAYYTMQINNKDSAHNDYLATHSHANSDYSSLSTQNANLQNQNNQLQAWLDGNKTLFKQTQIWLEGNITYLTLMMNDSVTLDFGDTEYTLTYSGGVLSDYTFIATAPYTHVPHAGDVYREFGIEIDVFKVGLDNFSNYIVIIVRPTVQNYMASLNYTEVNVAAYQTIEVNISSSLTNKTNTYWFSCGYVMVDDSFEYSQLTIQNASQNNKYDTYVGNTITDFDIEVRIFKNLGLGLNIVIYVKPLY